jgi:pyridoxine 4-dehydrogenase
MAQLKLAAAALAVVFATCDALMQPSNRRDFVTQSIATASASASVLSLPQQSNALERAPQQSISLPPIGLGAWAWGDSLFWGYDKKNDNDLKEVFQYALDNKQAFFDTAELYGLGRSEELIGKFKEELCSTPEEREQIIVASKFAALPWRTSRESVVKACKASVDRLGGPIELYQIHFPNSFSNEEYWDGIADCYDQGLVKAVGVSNYGSDAVKACHGHLAKRGIKLASNQIQMSLLYRWPIENGLLDTCKELDVKVLAYSPLALGYLTGKYTASNLPSGPRAKIGKQLFQDPSYENLLSLMRTIAAKHGDEVPISQVALNWCISKGTIPIPGARTIRQAKQNLSTLEWKLSAEEVQQLDDVSMKTTGFLTPDKNPFPRKDVNTGLIMYDS